MSRVGFSRATRCGTQPGTRGPTRGVVDLRALLRARRRQLAEQVSSIAFRQRFVAEDGFGVVGDVDDLLQRGAQIGERGIQEPCGIEALTYSLRRALYLERACVHVDAEEREVVAVSRRMQPIEDARSIDRHASIARRR